VESSGLVHFFSPPLKKKTQELRTLAAQRGFKGLSSVASGRKRTQKKRKEICAMNALVKDGYQPPTPELRTDFAINLLASFASICLHSRLLNNLGLSVLSVCSCSNSLFLRFAAELSNLQARNFQVHPGLETTLRRLKSSQDAPLANQQLAPIQLETNEKKCLRRQGYFQKIWVAFRSLVLAPLTLETKVFVSMFHSFVTFTSRSLKRFKPFQETLKRSPCK
jgi:hypothetical protein